ncbi:MAG: (d)CMP kinase [Opitutales bacterium]|nr:(d)CMP kinase [Opitutales bacterium]
MCQTTAFKIVSVDGGAASGKSSTSRGVAAQLNLMHVDTGSHYRAVTLACIEAGLAPEAPLQAFLDSLELGTQTIGNSARICLNGALVEDSRLRTDAVNAAVSHFAALPQVREKVKQFQRAQAALARKESFAGLIMEGRDIGSVIFPDADLKLYLQADEATRAARRKEEGQNDAISKRDELDKARKTAPLTIPEGAIVINTGKHSLEEVIRLVVELYVGNPINPSDL